MIYTFGACGLDTQRHLLSRAGQPVPLRAKAFAVLVYLVAQRDRVVPRQELCAQVWPGQFISNATLGSTVRTVRQAIGDHGGAQPLLQTLHGYGYRWVAPVVVREASADRLIPETEGGDVTLELRLVARTEEPLPMVAAPPVVPSVPPPLPGSERRQLTVLWCAVVDATTLEGQLDPEDVREVMGRYHATCTAEIQRYGGHVAQYHADGLVAYFGWPQAYEDNARRAVSAGVALVTTVRDLSGALLQEVGIRLALRIGIHTGVVVLGGEEAGAPYGHVAVRAIPHLAAQMQGQAAADTVVISEATAHLVQGYFVCEPLGTYALPGMTAPHVLTRCCVRVGHRGA